MKRKNSKTKIYKGGSRVRPNRGGVAQNARLDRGSVAHFTRLGHGPVAHDCLLRIIYFIFSFINFGMRFD